MHHELLSYKDSLVSYYRFGRGSQPVICFHGYGETALSFTFLEEDLGGMYTFHAIEMPYHGLTEWRQGLDFSPADLQQLVSLLPIGSAREPLLLGFSLGGRVALSLYELQPEAFRKIVLLAPDGLVVNRWYWLATQTYPGNRLFRFTMKHPGWFFTLLKGLNKTGKVNASVFKFVTNYIENPDLRYSLYQRWTALRKLKPSLSHIKSLIHQYKTPVRILYGKHDRIILPVRGEKFRNGIEEFCKIEILPAGHQLLQAKYIPVIENALK